LKLTLELVGRTPLLCHNVQLADPDNEFAKRLKEITEDKTYKKTDEGRKAMERIEWFGGLYTENGSGPVIPTANIKRCFQRAATTYKKGKDVAKALQFPTLAVPLSYDGPKDLEKLYKKPEHRSRLMVAVGTNKVPRMRPQLPKWSLVTEAMLVEEILDFRMLENMARQGFTSN
jgi:hypothetical protein